VILRAWWDMGSNSDYKPMVRIEKRENGLAWNNKSRPVAQKR